MEEKVSLIKGLQEKCADLEMQLEYYKSIATDTGQKRFREVEQLNRQIAISRNAEKEKQFSYERLMTVLDGIDAGVYVTDLATYEILFMNKKMIQDFSGEATGRKCWKVFRNKSKPCDDCVNALLLDEHSQPTGLHTWQGQNQLTGKHYVNYDRAIQWIDGRMAKVQISTDITQIKSMEIQLRQKYKMEAIGTMAGGIAHDFNNILAIITANLELMLRKAGDDNLLLSRIEQAKTASLRASELVKQILTFSRQGEPLFSPLPLSLAVEETLKLLRSTTPASVEMLIQIEDNARLAMVKANATQVDEMLLNLCNNAIYAMDGKGLLTFRLSRESLKEDICSTQLPRAEGDWLKLSVTDTGTGMPSEIVDKIFDPFFTTKPSGEGTGMGLSICYGISKRHNGFIVVDSLPGKGSTFSLYFPIVEVSENSSEVFLTKALPTGTEKILLVDDEEAIAQSISELLMEHGYSVTVETNGRNALELFKVNPGNFDAVITDQTMPELTGIEFSEELLKINPGLPIILCTGYGALITEKLAKEAGVKAFLMKPVPIHTLLEVTRNALDGKCVSV